MKLQFDFKVVPSAKDEKSNVIVITSLMTEDGKRYAMPQEYMYIHMHEELKKTDIFTKVKNKLKYRHDKVRNKDKEELQKTYVDEAGNIEFKDYLLDEIKDKKENHAQEKSELKSILEK